MAEPSLTVNQIIGNYASQGLDPDEIYKKLAARGFDADKSSSNAGSQKMRMSVGEYVQLVDPKRMSSENLRKDLFRRGIINPLNLSEEDFERPLPAARAQLDEADQILLDNHEQNIAQGNYKDWKWDPALKMEKRQDAAAKALIKGTRAGMDMDKVEAWIKARKQNMANAADDDRLLFPDIPEPELGKEEAVLAERLLRARRELGRTFKEASTAGGTVSTLTGIGTMLGLEPRIPEGEEGYESGPGVWMRDIGARLLAWRTGDFAEQAFPQKLLKNTPAGKAILGPLMGRRRSAIDELGDMRQLDEDSFELDVKSIEAAFGTVDKEGRVTKKGWFTPRGEKEKELVKEILNTAKVEKRLNKEKSIKTFTEWYNTSVYGTYLTIDHEENARQARISLDKQNKETLKSLPNLSDRSVKEVIEIWQGLYGLTSYVFSPDRTPPDNLSDMVGAGLITLDDAKALLEEKGFTEGGALFGGLAGYAFAYGSDWETFHDQIRNEPVSAMLALIPALHLLKGIGVARAASLLKKTKKIAKEIGVPDAEILKMSAGADKLATKKQKGHLRNWLDTARGKNAQSKFLKGLDVLGVPEMLTGAAVWGGAAALLENAPSDAWFGAGVGAGLSGLGHTVRSTPRMMRWLGDLAAQASTEGEKVTRNVAAQLFDHEGIRAALLTAVEEARKSGKTPDISELEDLLPPGAGEEFLARLMEVVDNDPHVNEAYDLYKSAPVGDTAAEVEQKALLRTRYFTEKANALNRFVEGVDGEPGVGFVRPSESFASEVEQIHTDYQKRLKKGDERIEKLEADRDAELQVLAKKQTASSLPKLIEAFNGQVTRQDFAARRLAKEAAEAEVVAIARRDEAQASLDAHVAERREMKPKGKEYSRAEALKRNRANIKNERRELKIAKEQLKKLKEKVKKSPGAKSRETWDLLINSYTTSIETHLWRIEFNTKEGVKLLEQVEDPGVALRMSEKKGKLVKGKIISYAEAQRQIAKRFTDDMSDVGKDRAQIEAHQDKLRDLQEQIADAEANAFDNMETGFPEDTPLEKMTVQERARARKSARFDRDIKKKRREMEADKKETQRQIDRAVRAKAAEYNRSINAAFGLHVRDGDYVVDIDTPVRYNRSVETKEGVKIEGSDRVTGVGKDEFGTETIWVGKESFEFDSKNFVEQPNGLRGTNRNFDLSTGNILTRVLAFADRDNIPPVLLALERVVDTALDEIAGVTATEGSLSEIRKALKHKARTIDDPKDPAHKKKSAKAIEKDKWADKVLNSEIMSGIKGRGVNDMRRILLEVYGDMIMNEGTARVLTDVTVRNRFVKYAEDIVGKHIFGPSGPPIDKTKWEIIRSDLSNMALDYAQGRTLDEWATFGRVNHVYVDEKGNPLKYVGIDGKKYDLTIKNLFREFIEGELNTKVISRARQHAITDALYYTARAADGRMAASEATLKATGVSRRVWERGGHDPEYQASVFKFYLRTGEMPPAMRVALDPDNKLVMNPKESRGAGSILAGLIDDPKVNTRNISLDEAANDISDTLLAAARRESVKKDQIYVRLGSKEDQSNIPGITRIGARPIVNPQVGISSLHNVIQPEHLSDINSSMRAQAGLEHGSDIVIRRELAESFGFMLDTHTWLKTETTITASLQAINALFKWGKTAASLLNPMTNFASNIKTYMISQGLDPARAWLGPAATADLWAAYRAGELTNTEIGNRLDHLMRTGFADQSQLVAEVDKMLQSIYASSANVSFVRGLDELVRGGVIPKTGGKRVPGVRELSEFQDFVYRKFGDELFKLTDSLREWDKMEKNIDMLPVGKTLAVTDLDTGAGFANAQTIGTITRIDDPDGNRFAIVMKHGKNRGKVIRVKSLQDDAAGHLIAKAAMGHSNSLYYNLRKGGIGIKMGRKMEAYLMQPFLSWRTKALDIPMVKRGMFYRMFGDDIYMSSDSALVNLAIHAEASERAMRRLFWVQVGKDHFQDNDILRRALPRWARRAIITGTGTDKNFFIAESSNPIGGMIWMMEFLADTDRAIRGPKGEKAFWDTVHGEKGGPMPNLTEAAHDLFSGGAITQVIYAFAGYDPLKKRPFETKEEAWAAAVKSVAPGWYHRTGMTDLLTGGALDVGSVPSMIIKELQAKVDFDPDKLGQASSIKRWRTGDASVSIVNSLLGRKYRMVDPIWQLNLITNIPGRLVDEIIRITTDAKKRGLDPESDEVVAEIQPIREAFDAYRRHIPRMASELKRNGIKSKRLTEVTEKIKRLQKKWKRLNERLP